MHAIVEQVISGDVRAVDELLKSDASLSNCTDQGCQDRSVLHLAADAGAIELVELLLAAGANPNRKDSSGISALHLAAMKGSLPVVKLLVEAGAWDVTDASGYDTRTAAMLSRDEGTIQYIRDWLGD